MQDAVILSQRDIARFQAAVAKLTKMGEALLNRNGHGTEAPVKKRRRKRRTSGDLPVTRRKRTPGTPDSPSSI